MNRREKKQYKGKIDTATKSIRKKCLDCSGGQPKEVRLCPVRNCALWLRRMGRRPTSQDLNRGDGDEK